MKSGLTRALGAAARGYPMQWFILTVQMTKQAIPNLTVPALTGFDEAALDKAFAALEAQAREAAAALDGEAAVETFRLEWLGRKQGR